HLVQVSETVTVEPPSCELERRIALLDALGHVAALPALQREALLQTVVGGQSHHQVAAALGLSDGAVRGLLYRARAKLRGVATAITPFPLVSWIAQAGGDRSFSSAQLSEAGSAGSAGIAAVLGKGGAIAVSAGVLAAGGVAVHSKLWPHKAVTP